MDNSPGAMAFNAARAVDLTLMYKTEKAVSTSKASTVFHAREIGTKEEVLIRQINCYEKTKNANCETIFNLFFIHNFLKKYPHANLPLMIDLSTKLPNLQVVTPTYAKWRTLKHY